MFGVYCQVIGYFLEVCQPGSACVLNESGGSRLAPEQTFGICVAFCWQGERHGSKEGAFSGTSHGGRAHPIHAGVHVGCSGVDGESVGAG